MWYDFLCLVPRCIEGTTNFSFVLCLIRITNVKTVSEVNVDAISHFFILFQFLISFQLSSHSFMIFHREPFISPQVCIGYRVTKSFLDTVRYWWRLNGSSKEHTLTLVSTHAVNPQPLTTVSCFWCSGLTLCLYVDFFYFLTKLFF